MKIEDAIAQFEAQFTHIETTSAYAPDIIVMGAGIEHEEGARTPVLCASPEIAAKMWLTAANAYAAGRGTKLVWRIKPEISAIKVYRWSNAATPDPEGEFEKILLYRVPSGMRSSCAGCSLRGTGASAGSPTGGSL